MNLICGLDVETTGLDHDEHFVTEVGAVLWDWDRKLPIQVLSTLVQLPESVEIPLEIQKLNGITKADTVNHGSPASEVFKVLLGMIRLADGRVMAHNAPFDWGFVKSYERIAGFKLDFEVKLLDTKLDIVYDPMLHPSNKLIYLAATHGFLNPFPHRAVFDVMTMLKVASQYPLQGILERSSSPTVNLEALVSYDDRQLAKDAGFQWSTNPKGWFKELKECDLVKEFVFKTRRVE